MLRSSFVLILFLSFVSVANAENRPNVLFIAVDDLNHWVGYTGRNDQAKTPNIDRLSERGMSFMNAYCAVPACNPSRAALMSGIRPWTSGCYTNSDPWQKFIPPGRGLSKQFLDAGYYVAGAGKVYHFNTFYKAEWSEYMDQEGLHRNGEGVEKMEGFHKPVTHDLKDEDIADWHVVNWCIERMQQERDEPFFIACGLYKPHLPFAVPQKYYDKFPLDEIDLPPYRKDDLQDLPRAGVRMAHPSGDHARFQRTGRWKAAIQSYLATVAYTDMNVGRLLDALDTSVHRDNTIVILWGDHGWHFGEKHHWRKFALWEEATRAPLIWAVPGMTKAGSRCKTPIDFMTIYPTLCELAGISIPDHVEGKSAIELLRDPKARWSEPAISTHGYKNHAVRKENWRFIQYADGSAELYDHNKDPYEWDNLLAQDGQHPAAKELEALLPSGNKEPLKKIKKNNKKKKRKKKASAQTSL